MIYPVSVEFILKDKLFVYYFSNIPRDFDWKTFFFNISIIFQYFAQVSHPACSFSYKTTRNYLGFFVVLLFHEAIFREDFISTVRRSCWYERQKERERRRGWIASRKGLRMRNDVSGLVEIASSKREHRRNIVRGSRFLLGASGRLIMLNIDVGTVLRRRAAILLRTAICLSICLSVCPSVRLLSSRQLSCPLCSRVWFCQRACPLLYIARACLSAQDVDF